MTEGGVPRARPVWAIVLTAVICVALLVIVLAPNALRLVVLLPLQGLLPEFVALTLTPTLLAVVWAPASRRPRRVVSISIVTTVLTCMVAACVGSVIQDSDGDQSDSEVSVVAVSPGGDLEVASDSGTGTGYCEHAITPACSAGTAPHPWRCSASAPPT
jgi:hypothetical protein